MIRKAFQMFDTAKSGFIETIKISTILNTMGQLFDDNELQALIDENDPECEYIHIFIGMSYHPKRTFQTTMNFQSREK